MAGSPNPPVYRRRFDFTDWEANNPVRSVPGTSLDAEFNALMVAFQRLSDVLDDMEARIHALEVQQ